MTKLFALIFICALSLNVMAQSNTDTYKNPDAPISERIEDLMAKMTLEEKIGQMTQLNISLINLTGKQKDVELNPEKARKYIIEHHIGSFLNGEAVPPQDWYVYSLELQKIAVEESRLGIPIIYGIDHMHGASYLEGATIFPHNINLGATFDPDFASQTGRITAIESADLGHHWIFAPVLDLGRDPNWPRVYETFGESYHVAGTMGSAYTKALINNDEIAPYKLAATGKHFMGYSVPRSGWDRTPVNLSDQNLLEFHAPSFKKAIEAGMQTMMLNSGEVNGVPVHASPHMIQDLLRDKLGFEGVIVTDWDDIGKLVDYHYVAEDYTEATLLAVQAGIDVSMTPNSLDFNESMLELAKAGLIEESRIDESVRRVLKLKFELGLFENPYPRNDRFERIGSSEHRSIALSAAEESLVLLKNEQDILPLSDVKTNILVLGPNANNKPALSGGWTISWQGGNPEQYPEDMETIFTAMKKEFPNAEITLLPSDASEERITEEAAKNDLSIVVIGEEPYTEFIGNITSLELPKDQQDQIRVAAKAGKPIIGIFVGGRPRIVRDVIDHMDAYLWAGLPGFEGADAIANVLSGAINPSGKLPFSYPLNEGHFVPYNHKPSAVYQVNANEANFIAQSEDIVWQYSFGEGLSYTSFEYSELKLSNDTVSKDGSISASVRVTNTGKRAGKESVIWFIKDHVGQITRPVKEVKHYEKITLKAGESEVVVFEINPPQHLSYPDKDGHQITEAGKFTLMVGELKAGFELQ